MVPHPALVRREAREWQLIDVPVGVHHVGERAVQVVVALTPEIRAHPDDVEGIPEKAGSTPHGAVVGIVLDGEADAAKGERHRHGAQHEADPPRGEPYEEDVRRQGPGDDYGRFHVEATTSPANIIRAEGGGEQRSYITLEITTTTENSGVGSHIAVIIGHPVG